MAHRRHHFASGRYLKGRIITISQGINGAHMIGNSKSALYDIYTSVISYWLRRYYPSHALGVIKDTSTLKLVSGVYLRLPRVLHSSPW